MNNIIKTHQNLVNKLFIYFKLVRLNKPVGSLLLLWPMLIALWVAGDGHPPVKTVFIFVAGCFLMRSCGCAVNDFADRKVDGHVHRTKNRPLAAGQLNAYEAVLIYGFLAFLSFLLVLCTNTQTIMLSFVALALATLYPFMKRFTHAPQLFLGFAFAWAVPMSYTAVTQTIPASAWYLYFATVIWAMAYDTQYALVDIEDDKKIGVKSTAIFFGGFVSWFILICHIATLSLLSLYAYAINLFGPYVWGCLVLSLGFVLYQHYLVKASIPQRCFKAFLNNQWLGGVWFIGFILQSRI